MSGRLKPGDVVECIDTGVIVCAKGTVHLGGNTPKLKTPVRVLSTFPDHTGCGCMVVVVSGGGGGIEQRFRKIDDEVEESFRLMLRSLKPKIPPEPAEQRTAGLLAPRCVAAHIFGEG